MAALASMDDDAAPAGTVGVDQGIDLADDIRPRQRFDDEAALPRPVTFALPVLDGATAADAEMRAERLDPLGAGGVDMHEPPAVGVMPRYRHGFDHLAGQRVGHIHRLPIHPGDAVAVLPDMIDGKALNHGGRR